MLYWFPSINPSTVIALRVINKRKRNIHFQQTFYASLRIVPFSATPGCHEMLVWSQKELLCGLFFLDVRDNDDNNCPYESMSLPPRSSCSDLCGGCVMAALKSLVLSLALSYV
ncbi:hypothetical protein ACFX16_036074 [Malus domestica]